MGSDPHTDMRIGKFQMGRDSTSKTVWVAGEFLIVRKLPAIFKYKL